MTHATAASIAYDKSASLMRVHGILSIVFGGIGTIAGSIFAGLFTLAMAAARTEGDRIALLVFVILTLVFWLIPHVYLIISGTVLLKEPDPKLAKVLTIINLVVGIIWNYVLLVFAIISLVQLGDYTIGYEGKKTK